MTAAAALVRASWRSALTYRFNLALSLGYLLLSVVPVYFIANALQATMADAIADQGDQYFAFLVVGMAAFSLVAVSVNSVHEAVSSGIRTGTLEALLGTPARPGSLLVGLTGYAYIWTAGRNLLLLVAATALGAQILWSQLPVAIVIFVLIVLAHAPLGLIAAAFVLVFRTPGPLPQAIIAGTGLLGGVYYPTHVIPSWIESLSAVLPLTYGARALRRTLLEPPTWQSVGPDVLMLCAFAVGLAAVGGGVFALALRHARRSGSLAQY